MSNEIQAEEIKKHTTKKGTELTIVKEDKWFYAVKDGMAFDRSKMIKSEDGMQELTNFIEKIHWEY